MQALPDSNCEFHLVGRICEVNEGSGVWKEEEMQWWEKEEERHLK